MDIFKQAMAFENAKMSRMTTSDRVKASREAKRLNLAIYEIYKETKNADLIGIMKRLTKKKKNNDKHLRGRQPDGI